MQSITEERIKAIENAYTAMVKRGWGFTSNGQGFGDPRATFTAVGPYHGVFVEVLGSDTDCVVAVQKAIENSEEK